MRQYLNTRWYSTNVDDFVIKPHLQFNNLKIYPKIGDLERLSGLLCDITELWQNSNIVCIGWNYGGFVPITCSRRLKSVIVYTPVPICTDDSNLPTNIFLTNTISDTISDAISDTISDTNVVFLEHNEELPSIYLILKPILVTERSDIIGYDHCIILERSSYHIYMTDLQYQVFMKEFYYYMKDGKFDYDNLIHLCIMVKNGGEGFAEILEKNMPFIDRWTILDTGSTDCTVDIIKRVLVGKKKGKLYQEPFLNFRDSRNRLLDLAGEFCTYTLMLDDTYYIHYDIRCFLQTIRGDQYGRSYSIMIKSNDSEYYSNRIIKTCWKLRYIYKLHEVIQDYNNINIVIPPEHARIMDIRSDCMEERTRVRKEYDLRILMDMLEEEPQVSRHLYYIAQTYSCMKNYEKAAEYFLKRAINPVEGFKQEIYDSYFECARLYNFQLGKSWSECEALYLKAHAIDPSRNDALYFLGIHYFLEGNESKKEAFDYFIKAFDLGYPVHCQFSLKPTLYYYFLPKFMAQLCYEFRDYKRGLACTKIFLENTKADDSEYITMKSWHDIFELLVNMSDLNRLHIVNTRPIIGVLDLESTPGILPFMQSLSNTYEISIFTDKQLFIKFLNEYYVNRVYIIKSSELIPLCIMKGIEEIYLILNTEMPSGNIIPLVSQLKNIICTTTQIYGKFIKVFPQCTDRCIQLDIL